jgi:hypothetical protein
MTTVDCPWCQSSAELTGSALECRCCGITVALADEAAALQIAA